MSPRVLLSVALLLPFTSSPVAAQVGIEDVHITEVYFCHEGGDDGYEWVEITNFSEFQTVNLSGAILAFGGLDYGWSTITLQGILPTCGRYVVGGPFSVPSNGSPVYDQVGNFEPDIQNGGFTADAVALFPAGTIDVTTAVPVDAVIYGEVNSTGLLDQSGLPGNVDVPTVDGPGLSIQRVTFAGTWRVTNPDPGETHFLDPNNAPGGQCAVVSTAPSNWGLVKSRF